MAKTIAQEGIVLATLKGSSTTPIISLKPTRMIHLLQVDVLARARQLAEYASRVCVCQGLRQQSRREVSFPRRKAFRIIISVHTYEYVVQAYGRWSHSWQFHGCDEPFILEGKCKYQRGLVHAKRQRDRVFTLYLGVSL